MSINRRRLAIAAAGVLFAIASLFLPRLRWNATPSLPRGLYWTSSPERLERGDIVLVCLTSRWSAFGRRRGYLGVGLCPDGNQPVGKRLAAIAGDALERRGAAMVVNGKAWPLHTRDSQGRPLEPFQISNKLLLEPGQLWLMGEGSRSWDSRYFGPVSLHQVVCKVRPLFTWSL